MEHPAPAWQQLIIGTKRVRDLTEQEGIQTACVPGACVDKTGNYSRPFSPRCEGDSSAEYHCGQNNYRFDALQFDCCRINL